MTLLRKQKGVAAVELALILPVLILIAFGTFQFGRSISYYNIMVKSVRDGARHLTLYAPGDSTRITEAKCLVVYGKTSCTSTDVPLVPGLTLAKVAVCDRTVITPTPSCPDKYYLAPITDPTNSSKTIGVTNLVTVAITSYTFNLSVGNFFGPDLFTFTTKPISETMMQVI
jgi:Flp pilus assembly protein TadG